MDELTAIRLLNSALLVICIKSAVELTHSYIYTIIVFLISLFMLFYVLCPADNVFVNATVRMLLLCCVFTTEMSCACQLINKRW